MIGTVECALPALPPALRASRPAAARGLRRDHVRLLVVDRATGRIEHSRFDRLRGGLGSIASCGALVLQAGQRLLLFGTSGHVGTYLLVAKPD